jgi:hypothetical protein
MTSKWLAWTLVTKPTEPAKPPAFSLKGHAVEFDRNGERSFLVASDRDAQHLMSVAGAARGETWTVAELDLIAAVTDQDARAEIARWKRMFNGILRPDFIRVVQSRKEHKR